jgi:hypothetical protein
MKPLPAEEKQRRRWERAAKRTIIKMAQIKRIEAIQWEPQYAEVHDGQGPVDRIPNGYTKVTIFFRNQL